MSSIILATDARISSSSERKKTMSRLTSSSSSRFKDSRGPIPDGRWMTRRGDSGAGRSDSTGSRKSSHDVWSSSVMCRSSSPPLGRLLRPCRSTYDVRHCVGRPCVARRRRGDPNPAYGGHPFCDRRAVARRSWEAWRCLARSLSRCQVCPSCPGLTLSGLEPGPPIRSQGSFRGWPASDRTSTSRSGAWLP
jgi:hypothetical protein